MMGSVGWSLNDPLYPEQWPWHQRSNAGIKVEEAWQEGIFGKDVSVAVIALEIDEKNDDISHYDKRFSSVGSKSDLKFASSFGTAAASIIGAKANNSFCSVGVAPQCNLVLKEGSHFDDLNWDLLTVMIHLNQAKIDVFFHTISLKSGSLSDFNPIDPNFREAIEYSTTQGRLTLGAIHVSGISDGTDLERGNCGSNEFASLPETITIGVIDSHEYTLSVQCASRLVVAPSDFMITQDRTCSSQHRINDTMGGGALVSGVVALILEANPILKWWEVQEVLILSSDIIHSTDPKWVMNQANLLFHPYFGFGLVNAGRAVRVAREYSKTVDRLYASYTRNQLITVPDNDPDGIDVTIVVPENRIVQHVGVLFSSNHNFPSDLQIRLTSPFGTTTEIASSIEVRDFVPNEAELKGEDFAIRVLQMDALTKTKIDASEYVYFRGIEFVTFNDDCCVTGDANKCVISKADVARPFVVIHPSPRCSYAIQVENIQKLHGAREYLFLETSEFDIFPEIPESITLLGTVSLQAQDLMDVNIGVQDVYLRPFNGKVRQKPLTSWPFLSVGHWGENAKGTWTVHVADMITSQNLFTDRGDVTNITLQIWYEGKIEPPPPAPEFTGTYVPSPSGDGIVHTQTPSPAFDGAYKCTSNDTCTSCGKCCDDKFAEPGDCSVCSSWHCVPNRCDPLGEGCNVCPECCKTPYATDTFCNLCVDRYCPIRPICSPEVGCNVCDKCCHSHILDTYQCMTCVTDECETLVVDPTEVEKIPLNWAAIVGSSLLIVVSFGLIGGAAYYFWQSSAVNSDISEMTFKIETDGSL